MSINIRGVRLPVDEDVQNSMYFPRDQEVAIETKKAAIEIHSMVEKQNIRMESGEIDKLLETVVYPTDAETDHARTLLGIPDNYKLVVRSIARDRIKDDDQVDDELTVRLETGTGYHFNPHPFKFGDYTVVFKQIHSHTMYRYDGLQRLQEEPCVGFSLLGPSLFHRSRLAYPPMRAVVEEVHDMDFEHPENNATYQWVFRVMACAAPVLTADLFENEYHCLFKFDMVKLAVVRDDMLKSLEKLASSNQVAYEKLLYVLHHNDPSGMAKKNRVEDHVRDCKKDMKKDKKLVLHDLEAFVTHIIPSVPVTATNNFTFRRATLFYINFDIANRFGYYRFAVKQSRKRASEVLGEVVPVVKTE